MVVISQKWFRLWIITVYLIFAKKYVIVIPWARVLCLVYMHKPEGRRPEGECVLYSYTMAMSALPDINARA